MSTHDYPGIVTGFYARHDEVDWDKVIRGARTLGIVVHYYNRWIREYSDAFSEFFNRGGKLDLIMADPEIADTLTTVQRHFFSRLTADELRAKIAETERVAQEIFSASRSPRARLVIRYFPTALHYSFVLTDSKMLYLSVYEQFRGFVIRSSVFQLDLRRDSGMEDYWREVFDTFVTESRLGDKSV